jgi:hypothetical protein
MSSKEVNAMLEQFEEAGECECMVCKTPFQDGQGKLIVEHGALCQKHTCFTTYAQVILQPVEVVWQTT